MMSVAVNKVTLKRIGGRFLQTVTSAGFRDEMQKRFVQIAAMLIPLPLPLFAALRLAEKYPHTRRRNCQTRRALS